MVVSPILHTGVSGLAGSAVHSWTGASLMAGSSGSWRPLRSASSQTRLPISTGAATPSSAVEPRPPPFWKVLDWLSWSPTTWSNPRVATPVFWSNHMRPLRLMPL